MTVDRTDFEVSYKRLERAASAALDQRPYAAAVAWLGELGDHVNKVIEDDDLDQVIHWSARLDRLADNLPATEMHDLAVGYLTAMMHRLDRAVAVLSQRRDVEERQAIADGVRPKVLQLVIERPRSRPTEIAKQLGIDPTQATRALRELEQRGLVRLAERDPADYDNRIRRYIAAQSAQTA